MFHSLTALVALILALGPATDALASQAATPATLLLVEQRVVRLADALPIRLSPDGRWLAAWRSSRPGVEICAFDTATLTEQTCALSGARTLAVATAVWSPDGTRLAFTENDHFESDLWLFDAESGIVTNLTDDGVAGPVTDAPTGTIDLAPAWSPDGRELAFVRLGYAPEPPSTAIYRIPASGGEPSLVHHVARHAWAVEDRLWWSASEEIIVYSAGLPTADQLLLGVYGVAPDGGEPREIGDDLVLYANDPIIIAVSARGMALLWFRASIPDPVFVPPYGLLDLKSGSVEILAPGRGVRGNIPVTAAFSPDGTRLLVNYADSTLAVRDLVSGQETTLAELIAPAGEGITWATNGLVFGRRGEFEGLLIQLAEG